MKARPIHDDDDDEQSALFPLELTVLALRTPYSYGQSRSLEYEIILLVLRTSRYLYCSGSRTGQSAVRTEYSTEYTEMLLLFAQRAGFPPLHFPFLLASSSHLCGGEKKKQSGETFVQFLQLASAADPLYIHHSGAAGMESCD